MSADYLRTLDVAHEKYYEQLGHPKARVDGTPPTDDVVAAVVAAARALGAPLGGEPAEDAERREGVAVPVRCSCGGILKWHGTFSQKLRYRVLRDAHVPREPELGQPARLVELEARAREGGGGVGGAGLLDAGQPIGKAERDARRAGGRRLIDARAPTASPDSGGR